MKIRVNSAQLIELTGRAILHTSETNMALIRDPSELMLLTAEYLGSVNNVGTGGIILNYKVIIVNNKMVYYTHYACKSTTNGI